MPLNPLSPAPLRPPRGSLPPQTTAILHPPMARLVKQSSWKKFRRLRSLCPCAGDSVRFAPCARRAPSGGGYDQRLDLRTASATDTTPPAASHRGAREARRSRASRASGARPGSATGPTASTAPRRASASTRSTRRRRRSAARCTSATSSPTRTPTSIARFQRMRGKAVFYPMGWDDNGLPTERRVQNYYGVRCDPSLPYDPAFEPPDEPPSKQPVSVSRPNFIELCTRLTAEDEKAFEQLWRTLGLSVDWSMTYATIGRRAQRVSQLAFLRPAGARRGVPARGADAVGRGLPDGGRAGRARGPRAAGRVSPRPVRRRRRRRRGRDRDDAPGADSGVRRARRASRR